MIHAQYVKRGGKTIWLFPVYWKRVDLTLCIPSFRMAFVPCIARYVWSGATQPCPRWPVEASQHRRGGPVGTEASSGVDFQWRAGSSAASFHCQFTINFAALTWHTSLTQFVRFIPTCTDQNPWVRVRLARHPRLAFHFTPASCSWLNAVEGLAAKLAIGAAKSRIITRSLSFTADNPVNIWPVNCMRSEPPNL